MEKLCLAQCKFTPLRACSADFFKNHPNPYISTFLDIAKSPDAQIIPQLTSWTLYSNDMQQAFNNVISGKASPEAALDEVQQHEQQTFDQHEKRWDRLSAILTEQWNCQ
jgi:maltose-binding protein MalE